MDFNEYDTQAEKTALYPIEPDKEWLYPALGLASEAGEVLGKLKKIYRDKNSIMTTKDAVDIERELGDVLWYLSRLSKEIGSSLNTVALINVMKLADRLERGTVKGNGDNR